MPYGQEVDIGGQRYEMVFTHVPTDVVVEIKLSEGTGGTEAQKDAVFQALLDKVATLSGVTINSAVKQSTYHAPITPTV